jgi:nitrogen fixation NifU-like protein
MSAYSTKVMEHFRNPQNVGYIENADGVGKVGNPVCGDIMELTIKVNDGKIADAKFRTFGCGAAIATSSMVTEMVKGKTIAEALEISNRTVVEALGGLPSIKMHCSVLAEHALKSAIEDYYAKHPEAGSPPSSVKAEDTCAQTDGKCVLETAKSG